MHRPLLSIAPMIVSIFLTQGHHLYSFPLLHASDNKKGDVIHRNASPWGCHS